jgi:hypothetical protein
MRLGLGLSVNSTSSQKVGGFTGILDEFTGAAAAYSVRRLSKSADKCLRVRRSSDDNEEDIAFDANGGLDTTALLAFVGTGGTDNGFVTVWYDQTTNDPSQQKNASTVNDSEQSKIVSGGTLVTEGSKAAIDFDGTDDHYDISGLTSTLSIAASHSTYIVHKCSSASGGDVLLQSSVGASDRFGAGYRVGKVRVSAYNGTSYTSKSSASTQNNNHILLTTIWDASNIDVYLNGDDSNMTGSSNLSMASTANTCIGAKSNGTQDFLDGTIQEIIIYSDDHDSTTQGGIETNINTHFSIF